MKMMPHIPEFRKESPDENTKEEETVLPYGKPGENTVCPLCVKWTSSGLEYDPHGEPPPNAIFWGDLPEAPNSSPSDSYIAPPALPSIPTLQGVRGSVDLSSPIGFSAVKEKDVITQSTSNIAPPALPSVPSLQGVRGSVDLSSPIGTASPSKPSYEDL